MILVDSNVWLDAADLDCPRHLACAGLLRARRGNLFTPALVVAESARLIRFKLGPLAEVKFLQFVTSGVSPN